MKFEEDFDFETANAQFHKDEIDKELQNKLRLKGMASTHQNSPKIQALHLFFTHSGSFRHFSIGPAVKNTETACVIQNVEVNHNLKKWI